MILGNCMLERYNPRGKMKDKLTIGVTDCSKYPNYERWVAATGAAVVKLSPVENNLSDIGKCDGIILSGGEDVHPRFYNKNEYLELCQEVDERRDEFEWKVLEYTKQNDLPLLGICRGLQMANVFFGGTLIPHIPAFNSSDHSMTGSKDRYHTVKVDPKSRLKTIVGVGSGEINSAHHQSADRIGKGLVVNAVSEDGIIEGIEGENARPYLQLVQWHPERMNDLQSTFSANIRKSFLEACAAR